MSAVTNPRSTTATRVPPSTSVRVKVTTVWSISLSDAWSRWAPLPLTCQRKLTDSGGSAATGLMPLWTRRHLHLPWLPIAEQTVVRGRSARSAGR
jgi:hypothetical protein